MFNKKVFYYFLVFICVIGPMFIGYLFKANVYWLFLLIAIGLISSTFLGKMINFKRRDKAGWLFTSVYFIFLCLIFSTYESDYLKIQSTDKLILRGVVTLFYFLGYVTPKLFKWLSNRNVKFHLFADVIGLLFIGLGVWIYSDILYFKDNILFLLLFVVLGMCSHYFILSVLFNGKKKNLIYIKLPFSEDRRNHIVGDVFSFIIFINIMNSVLDSYQLNDFRFYENLFILYFISIFVRIVLFEKLSISYRESKLFTVVSLLVFSIVGILSFVLFRDIQKVSNIAGLGILTWGVPKLFSIIQEKSFPQYEYLKDKKVKLKKEIDVLLSMVNISLYFILLILSYSVLELKNSPQIGVLDAIQKTINAIVIGLFSTVIFLVVMIAVFRSIKYLFETIAARRWKIFILNLISFVFVFLVLFLMNCYFKDKELIDVLRWSLPLFVPTVFKKIPNILQFISNNSEIDLDRSIAFDYLKNLIDANLIIVVFTLSISTYLKFFEFESLIGYLILIILSHLFCWGCSLLLVGRLSKEVPNEEISSKEVCN